MGNVFDLHLQSAHGRQYVACSDQCFILCRAWQRCALHAVCVCAAASTQQETMLIFMGQSIGLPIRTVARDVELLGLPRPRRVREVIEWRASIDTKFSIHCQPVFFFLVTRLFCRVCPQLILLQPRRPRAAHPQPAQRRANLGHLRQQACRREPPPHDAGAGHAVLLA